MQKLRCIYVWIGRTLAESDQVARRAKVCHLVFVCLKLRYCRWLRRYDDKLASYDV